VYLNGHSFQPDEMIPVVAAFQQALRLGQPMKDCYKAARDVWLETHPQDSLELAGMKAIHIVMRQRQPFLLPTQSHFFEE
jgi:hypothetical protein